MFVPVIGSLLLVAACSGSPYETTAAKMGSLMPAMVAGPVQGAVTMASSDQCGASQLQGLVGGPSMAATSLANIPGSSRHYGSEETVATDNPSRLNFVHSGTAVDSVMNPDSRVIRVFCG